jgi:hypothetical protein
VAQRLKAQETALVITRGGVVENTLTDVKDLSITFQSEVNKMGYLGQKTDLTDDVFVCVDFDFEIHTYTQDWLKFLVAVNDRQKRNQPNLVINLAAVLFYPGGDEPQIFLPDAKFGPLAMSFPERKDYVGKKISGSSDDWDLALS